MKPTLGEVVFLIGFAILTFIVVSFDRRVYHQMYTPQPDPVLIEQCKTLNELFSLSRYIWDNEKQMCREAGRMLCEKRNNDSEDEERWVWYEKDKLCIAR